jgi:hypothetical protein
MDTFDPAFDIAHENGVYPPAFDLAGFPPSPDTDRYFTTIGATLSQYYSIPSVTVDRIVMDVYSPTGATTGLPTGAPTPTANKYETLDFVYSGTINEIGRNGATYVPDGTIIANVNLYLSGTLIHSYAIDEDLSSTTTIFDSVGSNNGTAVNIAESQLFTEVDDGWEGVNQSLFSQTTILGDIADPEFSPSVFNAVIGTRYRVSATVLSYVGSSDCGWAQGGVPSAPPFRNSGLIQGDIVGGDYVATGSSKLFGRALSICQFDNITVKEFLEVAP